MSAVATSRCLTCDERESEYHLEVEGDDPEGIVPLSLSLVLYVAWNRRRRRLLLTTETLDRPIAAAA